MFYYGFILHVPEFICLVSSNCKLLGIKGYLRRVKFQCLVVVFRSHRALGVLCLGLQHHDHSVDMLNTKKMLIEGINVQLK